MQDPYVFYRRKRSLHLFLFDTVCDCDFNMNIPTDDLILPFSKLIKHTKLEKLFKQQSKSYIVAEEPHEIVQLDYSFKRLLVSTMFRSFLCTPGVSEKTRLGKKDRKV